MIEVAVTDIPARLRQELAVSDWVDVTQDQIDRFAALVDDRQWIHVDQEKALASPFGGTIAHGFLTLSLVSLLCKRALAIRAGMAINYGVNHVRFMSPVPSGTRLRGRFTPIATREVPGGTQVTWSVSLESEGRSNTCCSLEWIVRYYPDERAIKEKYDGLLG